MSVTKITTDTLRTMKDKEGLILQGCGGDLNEWVDGINDMLTEEKILLEGSRIEDCLTFEHGGLTCLYFPFDNAKIDMGKLAMWRLGTHGQFGGTWLSDYVPNRLGGFISGKTMQTKPNCPLIGQDGNIFNLMGIASKTLRHHGMQEQATEMCDRIRQSGSYGEALNIIGEYINITSVDDEEPSEDESLDQDQDDDGDIDMGGIKP